MKKLLTLEEKKQIEKDILDYIVSVCNNNNITYFLGYGTLLGAIRHQGFIPWDDDIDLVLLRPDYDRLITALEEENNTRYKVLYPKIDGYYYPFAKVVDTYTIVEEKNIDVNNNMGLWVDLFPLDGIRKKDTFRLKLISLFDQCRAASVNKSFPANKYSSLFYIPWCICRAIGYKFFMSLEIKESKRYSVCECDYVDFLPCRASNILSKKLFDTKAYVSFEGSLYLAPKNYDEYLKLNYGDYMKLPPEEERITHDMKAVLKEPVDY